MSQAYDRIYAVLAASRIGSAMGAAVECWSAQKIREEQGVLDRFLEYEHYNTGWKRKPGTTEDGIERQKLMCEAILRKQDRIRAADLVAVWIEVLDEEKMRFMTEGFDRDILSAVRSGLIPPRELGRFCPYFHINITARSFQAIPLINFGDEAATLEDLEEIGGVYQHPNSISFPWGRVYHAAFAAALRPGATVETVIEAGMAQADGAIRNQIEKVLAIAEGVSEPLSLIEPLNALYEGRSGPYNLSWIDENVCKSFALLKASHGDVRAAIVTAVNFGRDTDCTAASASSLVAALAGSATIPKEWIAEMEEADVANPYTCLHRSVEDTARGLHEALKNRVQTSRQRIAELEPLL